LALVSPAKGLHIYTFAGSGLIPASRRSYLLTVWIALYGGLLLIIPDVTGEITWSEYMMAPQYDKPTEKPLYIVKIAGDEVRAEAPDNPSNYILLKNIDPRTMRETDRAALTRGIEIYSMEELQYFLEDFGS